MQRADTVPSAYCGTLLQAVFVGEPLVSEAYSEPECPLRSFTTLKDLEHHIQSSEASYFTLALHYPETSGVVRRVRFALQPRSATAPLGARSSMAGASFSCSSSTRMALSSVTSQ